MESQIAPQRPFHLECPAEPVDFRGYLYVAREAGQGVDEVLRKGVQIQTAGYCQDSSVVMESFSTVPVRLAAVRGTIVDDRIDTGNENH